MYLIKKAACVALSLVFLFACVPARAQVKDVFRLHVIANSDSAFDQNTKLSVRDAVIEYEAIHSGTAKNAFEAESMLKAHAKGLLETVEDTLRRCGADYKAQLYAGEFEFPNRHYANVFYPAGEYRALRIVLGAGQGKNWWCVMFPPLCIVELDSGEIDTDDLKFDSLILKALKEIDGGRLWRKLTRESLR